MLHRVEPVQDETLIGYLMRVAKKNHLLGPEELITKIVGGGIRNIQTSDLSKIAYMSLNRIEDIERLSGYEQFMHGEWRWRVRHEWVSKSTFINLKQAKICPHCLADSPYLRDLWVLTFYWVCAKHGVRLLEFCANCKKRLKWNRRNPEYCGCGQNLRHLETTSDVTVRRDIAKLIAYRLSAQPEYLTDISAQTLVIERLAGLSVDGICKTVWFLARCVSDIGSKGPGHGRQKPDADMLLKMLNRTFELLAQWPQALGSQLKLRLLSRFQTGFSATECHQLMAPIDYYFQSSLQQPELHFLAHSYQQYLQHIWRVAGKRYPTSDFEKQLFLPF